MYPEQPLLRLKQSHNPHNLLKNFNGEVCLLAFLKSVVIIFLVYFAIYTLSLVPIRSIIFS